MATYEIKVYTEAGPKAVEDAILTIKDLDGRPTYYSIARTQ
jgi:hypothetical protein